MRPEQANLAALPRDSLRPLYQQIKDGILAKIRTREWRPGVRVPSENRLVRELGVSRMTIHRALRELAQQGHLNRVHGLGTFVAEPPRYASLIELRDIADEIQARGMVHGARVRRVREERAGAEIAARMEVDPNAALFHVIIVHDQDGTPIQLEDRFVNPRLAPRFLEVDFEAVTPTEYLVSLFRPEEMEHVVRAITPDGETRKALGMRAGEPCLRLSRRTWVGGEVVTTVELTYPGGRYALGARYATDGWRT